MNPIEFNSGDLVFVPGLSARPLYAIKHPNENGIRVYRLNSKPFNKDEHLIWLPLNGYKSSEGMKYSVPVMFHADKQNERLLQSLGFEVELDEKVSQWRKGKVEVNTNLTSNPKYDEYECRNVLYKFTSDHSIDCIDLDTLETFFTHYKSLTR